MIFILFRNYPLHVWDLVLALQFYLINFANVLFIFHSGWQLIDTLLTLQSCEGNWWLNMILSFCDFLSQTALTGWFTSNNFICTRLTFLDTITLGQTFDLALVLPVIVLFCTSLRKMLVQIKARLGYIA